MERNFTFTLKEVLKHEGGWADHPKDPGGATMRGVTLANFRRFVKPNATKDDLRKITDAQLQSVYKQHYWNAVRASELPDGLDYAVFDYAVNSGPAQAIKHLQRAIGVNEDGKIGPQTLKAIGAHTVKDVINSLSDIRMKFLKSIKNKKTGELLFTTFGKGWTSRVEGVRKASLTMSSKVKPESKNTVALLGAAGASSLDLVTVSTEVVSNIEKQQDAFSSGSTVRTIIGLIVLSGALLALYARWDEAGRPKFWKSNGQG
jgi:lysozyme family protein